MGKKEIAGFILLTFLLSMSGISVGRELFTPPMPTNAVHLQNEGQWQDLGLYGGQIAAIAIDPTKPEKIFAGSYMGDGLFLSHNGGASWQSVPGFRNFYCMDISIAPSAPDKVWVAYNLGVGLSTDGGASWSKQYLPRRYYANSVTIDPVDGNIVYVGGGLSGDGVIVKSTNGGKTWDKPVHIAPNVVTKVAISRSAPQELWALTGYNSPGKVYKSLDAGKTWSPIPIGFPNAYVNKIAINPKNHDIVYVSVYYPSASDPTLGVIFTTNGGESWQSAGLSQGCVGLAVDPSNPDTVYASTAISAPDNELYKSTDGGLTWTTHPLGYRSFKALAVDAQHPDTLYGGSFTNGVLKSKDWGINWQETNAGVRANIVYASAFDPNNPDILLAGTQCGLFKRDATGQWQHLYYRTVYSIAYDPLDSNTIYLGTLYKLVRTTDYGQGPWYELDVNLATNESHRISSIVVDHATPQTLYLGVLYYSGEHGEVYKSTDAGDTVSPVMDNNAPINTVAIDPTDPEVIYAGSGFFYTGGNPNGAIHRSVNAGRHWSGPLLENVVANSIRIDPFNSKILYVGTGTSGAKGGINPGLYKSIDRGRTWSKVRTLGVTITDVQIDPALSSVLYAASFDAGVFESVDSGRTWTNLGLSDYYMFDLSVNKTAASVSVRDNSSPPAYLVAGTNSLTASFAGSTITGQVTNKDTGAPIQDALISVTELSLQNLSDALGTYQLFPDLCDNCTLACSAPGFATQTRKMDLVSGPPRIEDFQMVAAGVPPVAAFAASPTSGAAPLVVSFSDQSSGSVSSWSWDFGDGATSNEQNPVHTYVAPNSYTVILTTIGPGGADSETKPDYISVSPGCENWECAYRLLFATRSDLSLLRRYRDQVLKKSEAGRLFTRLLYENSIAALQVLIAHPDLLAQAKNLLKTNRDDLARVVDGKQGVLRQAADLISFLETYAAESSPALKALAKSVKDELVTRQRLGEPFLGFSVP